MNMERFFASLTQWGISVHLDENGALRVKGKKEKLTAAVVSQLKTHKSDIAAWLRQTQPKTSQQTPSTTNNAAPNAQQGAVTSKSLSSSQQAAFDELSLHGLIEVQASEHPERVALHFADRLLTYAQLNLQANRLAYHLRQQGLEAEGVVAIALTPGIDQIIALLAVLKAGGAYLPLDDHWDDDAQLRAIKEGEVSRIICDDAHFDMVNVLMIDDDSDSHSKIDNLDDNLLQAQLSECSGANPSLLETQSAYSLAAILYTRGSGGNTKGVMIEHGNVTCVIKWPEYIDVSGDNHWLMNHPLTSRWSLLNIFAALCHGGCLFEFLPANEDWTKARINQLTGFVVDAQQLQLVVEHSPRLLNYCQSLILADEPPGAKLLNQVFAQTNDLNNKLNIVQVYGCLETALFATWHPLLLGSDTKRLGQSVAASECFVLNHQHQSVAKGEQGQIFIGGLNVARGYADGWQLSEQFFIPSPFSDDPNQHIFATGDSGTLLGNGEILLTSKPVGSLMLKTASHRLNALEALFTQAKDIDEQKVAQPQPCDELPSETQSKQSELLPYQLPQNGAYIQPIWYSKPRNTVDQHHWSKVKSYVLFTDSFGIGQQLAEQLIAAKQQVILVSVGESFAQLSSQQFSLNPQSQSDYQQLLAALNDLGLTACHVVHLWSLTLFGLAASCEPVFEQVARLNSHKLKGLTSVDWLFSGFADSTVKLSSLTTVSHDILSVTGDEVLIPSAAMIVALGETQPSHNIFHIDLSMGKRSPNGVMIAQLSQYIYDELTILQRPKQVAYRGTQRWLNYMASPNQDASGQSMINDQGNFVLFSDDLAPLSALIDTMVQLYPSSSILVLSQNVAVVNYEFAPQVETLHTQLSDFNQLQSRLAQINTDVGSIEQIIVLPGMQMSFDNQVRLLLSLDSLFSQYAPKHCLVLSPTQEVFESQSLLTCAEHLFHRSFVESKAQTSAVNWRCVGYSAEEVLADEVILPKLLQAQADYCLSCG